jgi:molybdopterin molybdotransferase
MKDISLTEALHIVKACVTPLPAETADVDACAGRAAAETLMSLVDSPTDDVSLKDGFAVAAEDLSGASDRKPVTVRLAAEIFAGGPEAPVLGPGLAARITTGARIPAGADAVLSAEFASVEEDLVTARAPLARGQNILFAGTDIRRGQVLVEKGEVIRPAGAGLLAAAGHAVVPVTRNPKVTVIATGDEVVAPGKPAAPGKVYASNLVTLAAWCRTFSMRPECVVVADREDIIAAELRRGVETSDAVLTSGGAWTSDRDLVVRVLDKLGWDKKFHRLRLGPGKAVAFGLLRSKPVFCLPGGPPSNHSAFLQVALPGLLRLAGRAVPSLPTVEAVLDKDMSGQKDWTQVKAGVFAMEAGRLVFSPRKPPSRLQSLADTQGIVLIPEGVEILRAGTMVQVQVLHLPENQIDPVESSTKDAG